MFDNNDNHTFQAKKKKVPGITKDTLGNIIHFIYVQKLYIDDSQLNPLVHAANLLSVPGVIDLCKEYVLLTLDEKNCLSHYKFCEENLFMDLKEKILSYILVHFEKIYASNPYFCQLSFPDLETILSSDKLNVKEETAYWALIKWVETDTSTRQRHLPDLLRCVRIGLCDPRFFDENVWTNSLVSDQTECNAIMFQASQLFYDLQNGDNPQAVFDLHHPFLRPRVPHELIFVIGGWSNGGATTVMETYDVRTLRWFLSLNLDTVPRAYHGLTWHQNKIYIIGGFDGNQCFNSVRCYDPVTHMWEERGCMHVRRCYVSVASLEEYIYAMGGYDGHRRSRSCERYDLTRNQWEFVENMHIVRSDASADILQGCIYVVGGFNGIQVLDSSEYYNPRTNQWTLIHNMTSPRSGVKAASFRGHLFAIGGFNGNNRLGTVEKYDLLTQRWSQVAPMLGPRSNFATAIVNDQLYAIGGFNGLTTVSTAEVYDASTNEWKQVTDLNLNRSALAACKVSGISSAHEYTFLGNN